MAWTKTYAGAEPQRVNKWLAQQGICSRREAEALIEAGLISIDAARVVDAGHKILPGQTLVLADKAQSQLSSAVSCVLNKPIGFVSAQPEGDQIPAARLLTKDNLFGPPASSRQPTAQTKLAPLGRLDQDSRGLLLLSEDGVLAKAIIGPESQLEKEYLVRVSGALSPRK
jgi:23S rRNA pseudouridine2604 synthase